MSFPFLEASPLYLPPPPSECLPFFPILLLLTLLSSPYLPWPSASFPLDSFKGAVVLPTISPFPTLVLLSPLPLHCLRPLLNPPPFAKHGHKTQVREPPFSRTGPDLAELWNSTPQQIEDKPAGFRPCEDCNGIKTDHYIYDRVTPTIYTLVVLHSVSFPISTSPDPSNSWNT